MSIRTLLTYMRHNSTFRHSQYQRLLQDRFWRSSIISTDEFEIMGKKKTSFAMPVSDRLLILGKWTYFFFILSPVLDKHMHYHQYQWKLDGVQSRAGVYQMMHSAVHVIYNQLLAPSWPITSIIIQQGKTERSGCTLHSKWRIEYFPNAEGM